MKKALTLLFAVCSIAGSNLFAQSIWDESHLQTVKQSLTDPLYATAYERLVQRATRELDREPVSVMMKTKTPASGDKHDYMSQARYYWPDTTKVDGLPYINRDGVSNPELNLLDRNRLGQMANSVINFSLAWYFSGDQRFADKATEMIRVWFLNEDTRMNPNLNYAQMIPGHDDGKGRSYGIIDAYSFIEMLDGIQLMEKGKAFPEEDSEQLKVWFGEFLNWLITSKLGQDESRQKNNHSVAYDVQVIAIAMYSGDNEFAGKYIREFPEKRIYTHIEPDGRQPNELWRTLTFGYSQYNLSHMIDIFQMAQKLGISIDQETSPDGRNFYKGVDFLAQYLGKDVMEWPYEQISEWNQKQQALCQDLYRIYKLNPSRTDYLELYRNHIRENPADRFNLLYLRTE